MCQRDQLPVSRGSDHDTPRTRGPRSGDAPDGASTRGPATNLPPSVISLYSRFFIPNMSPARYARALRDVEVLYASPDGGTGTTWGAARHYLNCARGAPGPPELVDAAETAKTCGRRPPGGVSRIHFDEAHFHNWRLTHGVGSLKDIQNFLSYVVTYRVAGATPDTLRSWCRRHSVGVDCNGFAAQYLVGIGAIPSYVQRPRSFLEGSSAFSGRRTDLSQIRQGDTVVWYPFTQHWWEQAQERSDGTRPSRSHIAIVEDLSGNSLTVAESVGRTEGAAGREQGPRVSDPAPFELLGAGPNDHQQLRDLRRGEQQYGPFFRFTEGTAKRQRPCVVLSTADAAGQHYQEE